MTQKIEIMKNRGYLWPNKCPLCENKANSQDTVFKSKYEGTGYFLVFFTYRQTLHSLSYPICKKHKYYAKFLRFTYWTLLIPVIALGIGTLIEFNENLLFIFLLCLALFLLSIKLQPIRIAKVTDNSVRVIVRNDKYAEKFNQLNP